MKILAIHTANNKKAIQMQVDIWRLGRPLRELKKHVDWQIDERSTLMKHIAKYKDKKDFTEKELQETYGDIKQYDIIWASYSSFMHGMVYALCKMAQEKDGTKLVLDVDDNMFSITPSNVGWWANVSHEKTHELQTIVRDCNYITTTNDYLADVLRSRSNGKKIVKVVPNFISLDYKSKTPNNEDIEIGYFGGASHFNDLHVTGFLPALERLMHENKKVRFTAVGMPIEHYLPTQRYTYVGGLKGHAWYKELFPTLQFDISVAPLTYELFNLSKSDIKWQEASLIPSAVIASDVRPYTDTISDGKDGLIVQNTEESWYRGLKKLVDDTEFRKRLATNAKNRVIKDFLIENNWTVLKKALEEIHES